MKIFILCTANTCRSPMAEGIVKQLLEQYHLTEQLQVQSMGFAAHDDQHASNEAIAVMAELGVDISAHRARRIMKQDVEGADMCYVMTLRQKHILVEETSVDEGSITVLDIPDPYGHSLDTYRACRDEIKEFFEAEFRRMGQQDA